MGTWLYFSQQNKHEYCILDFVQNLHLQTRNSSSVSANTEINYFVGYNAINCCEQRGNIELQNTTCFFL